MTTEFKTLLKEVAKNLLLALGIFAAVFVFLYFCGLVFNEDGKLIDSLLPLELAAGIVGSAYVLIVRNPNNYLGFIVGILMSILLGIQFFLQGFKDQTLLYYCIFIPCQVLTLTKWISASKGTSKDSKYAVPSFMGVKGLFIGLGIFMLIILSDLFVIQPEITWITFMSACVVAASAEANFLMIRKHTDAWFYWVAFSIFGIIQMILLHNYVTLTLYVIYIFINGNACIAWCKNTPKDRYGWVEKIIRKQKTETDITKKRDV